MVPTIQATMRLAQDLVANYGDDAEIAATERAEAMESIGNSDAAELWAAVSVLIAQMRGRPRRADA